MIFLNKLKEKKIKSKLMCVGMLGTVFTASTLSASSFRSVSIIDGNKEITTVAHTFASTDDVLKKENVKVGKEDSVFVEEETDSSVKIRIQRDTLVSFEVDGSIRECPAFVGQSVSDVLKENFIYLNENDKISKPLDEKIQPDTKVKIERCFKLTVNADSCVREFVVPSSVTIKEALESNDIKIGEFDVCAPCENENILSDITVTVDRVGFIEVCRTEEVPFRTQTIYDSSIDEGSTTVEVEGKNGQSKVVSKKKTINGSVQDQEEEISRKIIKEPVKKVVRVGTKKKTSFKESGEFTYRKVLRGVVTAYSPRAGARTSLGEIARHGVVAVDPRVIPYGAKLYIPGYGFAVAGDTGGAMVSGRVLVDVFFNSERDCMLWGRRTTDVYVL